MKIENYIGKTIIAAENGDNYIELEFDDNSKIAIQAWSGDYEASLIIEED